MKIITKYLDENRKGEVEIDGLASIIVIDDMGRRFDIRELLYGGIQISGTVQLTIDPKASNMIELYEEDT